MPAPRTKRSPTSRSSANPSMANRPSPRSVTPSAALQPARPSHSRRMAIWRAGIAAALVLLGAFFLHRWPISRQPAGLRTASPALPDPPDAQEKALLTRLSAARPGDPAPARLLGEHYLGAGRPFAALWTEAFALQAQPADAAAMLDLVQALDGAQFYEEAIARLQPAPGRPQSPETAAQLAELYLRTGRPEQALAVVQRAGAVLTGSKDGAVLEGRVRQALGDAAGAKAAYWRAVGLDANDAEVRRRIGRLALSQGELSAAQQALGAAAVLVPDDPRGQVDLGRAFDASSRTEDRRRAEQYYTAALSQAPQFAPAHLALGNWYLDQSRRKEAIEQFQLAVSADPGDAEAHEALARALEADGRRAEAHRQRGLAADARGLRVPALQEYGTWAALAPDDPQAAIQAAQSEFDVDRTKQAEARLERARRRFPRDAALRERLIAFYLLGLDQEQARRLCQEWLREEAGSPAALWLLGRAAEASRQYDEAVRLYEQALSRDPDNPQWLGALGGTLLAMPDAGPARARQAVAALARAATGDPHEPRWRLFLAQALLRLGRPEEARRQALRALDLDPRQSRAYTVLLQCARQQHAAGPLSLFAGLQRAVEARLRQEQPLRQATWDRPRDPAAYAALAAFLLRTGDPAAAEPQLAEALRLRPASPDLHARLVLLRRLREVL